MTQAERKERAMKSASTRLLDLAKTFGLSIEIRAPDAFDQWYVYFNGVEEKDGGLLRGHCGRGATPEQACADYIKAVAGKRLVVDAMTDNRREFSFEAPDAE